jgi:hypothetical protein
MAGQGPPPKGNAQRRRRNAPARGEWKAPTGAGWQHGPVPEAPDGLLEATRKAWAAWFESWFAAYWTPDDLTGLRKVAQLYDATERGDLTRSSELRLWMDNYGLTPEGQAKRRWTRFAPAGGESEKPAAAEAAPAQPPSPYGHLRVAK